MEKVRTFRVLAIARNMEAMVSPEDYERVAKYPWHPLVQSHTTYAQANDTITLPDGRKKRIKHYLHRMVTNAADYLLVDHEDHNGLNCCRWNLRTCTSRKNNENRVYGAVDFRGVGKQPGGKYYARISDVRGEEPVRLWLGLHDTAEEAARAYDRKAIEIYGEFFGLNFPREDYNLTSSIARVVAEVQDIPF